MKKEQMVIEFADGTKGTITTETITGRVDVKAAYNNMTEFYYAERIGRNWIVKICINGFCNDAVIIVSTKTRSAAISEIIQNVKRNQSITAGSAELPTPSDEPKTEEEEEAENEHFVKQMSESEPEYMGVEYTDALHMNNWKEYLLDTLYEGEDKHEEIYIVVSDENEVSGWFWFKKGAEQFHSLHGGKIIKVTSALFYIQKISNLYQEIIKSYDIDGMSIISQLIYNGYRVSDKNTSAYIFECLQDYCYLYETDTLLRKHFDISYSVTITTYLKLTQNELDNNKETEKTLLAFCVNMLYLTDYAIFNFLQSVMEKEGENNDNC